MAQGSSLKDDLFNAQTVGRLGGLFAAHIDAPAFEAEVLARFPELELKERINWIAEVLSRHLEGDFPAKAAKLRDCLPPPLDPTLTDDDFGHFIFAPLGVIVEREGLEAHRDLSLDLLEAINQRLKDMGITMHLSEVKGPVMDRLIRSHFLEEMTGQIFLSQYEAFEWLKRMSQEQAAQPSAA